MDMLMSWLGPLGSRTVSRVIYGCGSHASKKTPSPLLRKFEPVLQTIFSDGRRKTRTRATKSKRRRLSTTARRRPETRESRGEDTTQVLQAASDSDHGSADIKTETGFQDGSVHAPLAVYDEALFDARLKFGRKKTLSQVEIDLYFPKPET
ncbi:hypothetical protein PF001_g12795 [Phytophthora fragariae]|uniref:Uncharacterized protein n=1 Tax=Phytophthora fragariae TaxID=53985 RepID=A0A6A4DAQ3_9STRA|nr:hypothetical protein PF001_g12795 [Phytophthora fragariae]